MDRQEQSTRVKKGPDSKDWKHYLIMTMAVLGALSIIAYIAGYLHGIIEIFLRSSPK